MSSFLGDLSSIVSLATVSLGESVSFVGESLIVWGGGRLVSAASAVPHRLSTSDARAMERFASRSAALFASLLAAVTVPLLAGLLLDYYRSSTAREGGTITGRDGKKIVLTSYEMEIASAGLVDGGAIDVTEDFLDVGGLDAQVATLREQVVLPLERPALTSHSRVLSRPTGLLLFGPPGSGKTLLAKSLAKCSRARFLSVSPSCLHSKWVGDSVRLVAAAFSLARKLAPTIMLIDEIDGLLPNRENRSVHFSNVESTTTFLKEWEGIASGSDAGAENWVLVVGATNRPFDLDPAVLRRMPHQLEIPLPDAAGRAAILTCMLRTERTAQDIRVEACADAAVGFSGSDLRELVRQAAWIPVREAVSNKDKLIRPLSTADLLAALDLCAPTGAAAAEFGQRRNGRVEVD